MRACVCLHVCMRACVHGSVRTRGSFPERVAVVVVDVVVAVVVLYTT